MTLLASDDFRNLSNKTKEVSDKAICLICECDSLDHHLFIFYDESIKCYMTEVHLQTNRNVFQRIWYSLKYIFGYKCRYGAWDEFLLSEDDINKLTGFKRKIK